MNRSQCSQPIVGVRAKPLSSALALRTLKKTKARGRSESSQTSRGSPLKSFMVTGILWFNFLQLTALSLPLGRTNRG